MPNKELRFLVTGATGVLGKRLVRLLKEKLGLEAVLSFEGDITSPQGTNLFLSGLDEISHVIHCASIVSTKSVEENPLRAYQVNSFGTGILMEEIGKHFPNAHTLLVSSSHVYRPSDSPIAEDGATEPINVYGRTKLMAEFIGSDIAAMYAGRVCVARVFSFYAEDQGESFLYASLKRRLESFDYSKEFELKGANNVRDFLSADEVAECLMWLSTSEIEGVINVGSGRGTTISDFARKIASEDLLISKHNFTGTSNKLVADLTRLKASGFFEQRENRDWGFSNHGT